MVESEATAILLWELSYSHRHREPTLGSHQIICINLYGIFKSIKKLYVVILTKEKKKKHASWSGKTSYSKSTITEAHPFNHLSHFTSSAHTEQFSCTAQLVVRSQNSDQQQRILSLISEIIQLCTSDVLQHKMQWTELKSSHERLKCRWQRLTWKCIMYHGNKIKWNGIKKIKIRSKQMMCKAVVTNKMTMIWDVLAGHLMFLSTTIYHFVNSGCTTDRSLHNLKLKMNKRALFKERKM